MLFKLIVIKRRIKGYFFVRDAYGTVDGVEECIGGGNLNIDIHSDYISSVERYFNHLSEEDVRITLKNLEGFKLNRVKHGIDNYDR